MTPEEWTAQQLRESGMSPDERNAQWDKVDPAVVPSQKGKGFGISGPTGCGKTYAMAAWIKEHIIRESLSRRYKPQNPMTFNEPAEDQELLWVSWPEAVGKLRSPNAYDWSEKWYEHVATMPFLVLDDVGAERIKGSYAEDWAANFLDRIVDHRFRYNLPTWWTTNLDGKGLILLYGARMVSRLMALNPLFTMIGKDRRFLGGAQ